MVKDHRTNYEEKEFQPVLDGEIDNFIESVNFVYTDLLRNSVVFLN